MLNDWPPLAIGYLCFTLTLGAGVLLTHLTRHLRPHEHCHPEQRLTGAVRPAGTPVPTMQWRKINEPWPGGPELRLDA